MARIRIRITLLALGLAALACNGLVAQPATPSALPPTATGASPAPLVVAPSATPTPSPVAIPATATRVRASATPSTAATETATAAPSAQPTLIAYLRQGQLLVTDVTKGVAGATIQVTQTGVYDLRWSPSGQSIAFVATVQNDPHLFVVSGAGQGAPVDLGPGSEPNWSPDSARLAYVRAGNIWITSVDNPQPQALTTQNNWVWGRPTFRPAGDALVVSGVSTDSMGASGNTQFTLNTLQLDGSGTLTPLPGLTQLIQGELPYDLRFSPDGSKLAFTSASHVSACASAGQYFVANADGSGLTPLTSPAMKALPVPIPNAEIYYMAFGYAWAPPGDALLITSYVIDCTNFAGTQLGAQLSTVSLSGQEMLIAKGYFTSPSYDHSGTLIAVARHTDNSSPGDVILYDPNAHLVLDLGQGDQPAFQP